MTDVVSKRTGRPKVRKTTISLSPEAFEAAHREMAARVVSWPRPTLDDLRRPEPSLRVIPPPR